MWIYECMKVTIIHCGFHERYKNGHVAIKIYF